MNLIECDQNLPEFVRIFLWKSIDNAGKICHLRGYWQNPWNMPDVYISRMDKMDITGVHMKVPNYIHIS